VQQHYSSASKADGDSLTGHDNNEKDEWGEKQQSSTERQYNGEKQPSFPKVIIKKPLFQRPR
jgi:hypothetical protein